MSLMDLQWNHSNISNNLKRSSEKQEIITLRARYTNSKKVILCVSIGLIICQIIKFKEGEQVNIFLHKKDKDLLMIKKCVNGFYGHTLSTCGNFLKTGFTHNFHTEFKIKQTIQTEYEIQKEGEILINISNLKWKK